MIKGIQIIGILVGSYLIGQTILNFKRGNLNVNRAIFWLFLWSSMIVLFFNPSTMRLAMPILSTQDMIMSVLVLSLTGVFFLIAQLYQKMINFERRFTKLVQGLAIHEYSNAVNPEKNDNE